MLDSFDCISHSPKQTQAIATHLSATLYAQPTTICLFGEVGAGKTTFMQGFAPYTSSNFLPSPTYNLEHRYHLYSALDCSVRFTELVHVDLYRLSVLQATEFWEHCELDSAICCIEWPERLQALPSQRIDVHITALPDASRQIRITWQDVPLPLQEQIEAWRTEVLLPVNIIDHCTVVTKIAAQCCDQLLQNGIPVRKNAVVCAAELHDLLRFLDFKPEHASQNSLPTLGQQTKWQSLLQAYGTGHEQAVEQFLIERGFGALGFIIRPHGSDDVLNATIEQKILMYSDKRAAHAQVVSVQERYEEIIMRHYNNVLTPKLEQWFKNLQQLEQELQQLGVDPNIIR